jgi:hypothetical protein
MAKKSNAPRKQGKVRVQEKRAQKNTKAARRAVKQREFDELLEKRFPDST